MGRASVNAYRTWMPARYCNLLFVFTRDAHRSLWLQAIKGCAGRGHKVPTLRPTDLHGKRRKVVLPAGVAPALGTNLVLLVYKTSDAYCYITGGNWCGRWWLQPHWLGFEASDSTLGLRPHGAQGRIRTDITGDFKFPASTNWATRAKWQRRRDSHPCHRS